MNKPQATVDSLSALLSQRRRPAHQGGGTMPLDLSATSVQTNVRSERPLSPYAGSEGEKKAKSNRSESGQTSQASPDVVTRISAAALEASRALTQAGQAADKSAAEESVRASERREPPPEQPPEQRTPSGQRFRGVNLVV